MIEGRWGSLPLNLQRDNKYIGTELDLPMRVFCTSVENMRERTFSWFYYTHDGTKLILTDDCNKKIQYEANVLAGRKALIILGGDNSTLPKGRYYYLGES